MPSTSLSAGGDAELYAGGRGDTLYIRTDGDIRVSKYKEYVRDGRKITADSAGEIALREDTESVYVYAVEAATVEYAIQGFSISLFDREVTRTKVQSTPAINHTTKERIADYSIAANGGQDLYTETAPAGKLREWIAMELVFPAPVDGGGQSASSGDHEILIYDEDVGVDYFYAKAPFDQDITFNYGYWTSGGSLSVREPGSGDMEQRMMAQLTADEDSGVTFDYRNGTDVQQHQAREFRYVFKDTDVQS